MWLEPLKRSDILKNAGHCIVWKPVLHFTETSFQDGRQHINCCCCSLLWVQSMHSASLYCRFLLALIKEVGGRVLLQLTGRITPDTFIAHLHIAFMLVKFRTPHPGCFFSDCLQCQNCYCTVYPLTRTWLKILQVQTWLKRRWQSSA